MNDEERPTVLVTGSPVFEITPAKLAYLLGLFELEVVERPVVVDLDARRKGA